MSTSDNPAISIRQATPQDIELLVSLARDTFVENYEHLNDPIHFWDYVDEHLTEDCFSQEMHTPGSTFYLAYHDGFPAGYFKLNCPCSHPELSSDTPQLELARIYVQKIYQQQGIGQAEVGRAAGCGLLWLGVWQKNYAAVTWYQKQGLQIFGETVFMMGADPQEDWLMCLAL